MLSRISFTLALTLAIIFISPNNAELKTYIVHLNLTQSQEFAQPQDLEGWYSSFLPTNNTASDEKPTMVYAYHHVLKGFAAKLSEEQAKAMENMKGVVSVSPERILKLHTTHTPDFLGLHQSTGFLRRSSYGKGMIIGIIDTGITPAHPSFSDKGVPPPPKKWKGKCEVAGCNNKLIGMRNFEKLSSSSLLDLEGHGTHTSSTVAGNFVHNANVYGNANGTARGMAPLAHVAMYRVCGPYPIDCPESSILAGMDAAIEDGVDVLSLSLGGGHLPFYLDVIATAAFSAIQKGIFVSCSAGNDGPWKATVTNEASWILTVGASNTDRRIRTTVYLGNKELLDGESVFQPMGFTQEPLPLVYPGTNGDIYAALCRSRSLKKMDIRGKVVMCDTYGTATEQAVKDAGGAAVILMNDATDCSSTTADVHILPASLVSYRDGLTIKRYFDSTSSPVAAILFRGTIIGVDSAPEVVSFSSRGPSLVSPGILKPDIVGPGASILAAWHKSVENKTQAKATFNIISGTSMSCPHIAGIAALLKKAHPDWSPAAIKSALMTTTSQESRNGHSIQSEKELPADVFAIGAGHVNLSKANDPGLVFDIEPDDYIPYLCGLGYTHPQVESIVKKRSSCSKTIPEAQLNYPSFYITLAKGKSKTYTRTVTNIGKANSTYIIGDLSLPHGISVQTNTSVLNFTKLKQKMTYEITFTHDSKVKIDTPYAEGHMTWTWGKYSVRTPFAFEFM